MSRAGLAAAHLVARVWLSSQQVFVHSKAKKIHRRHARESRRTARRGRSPRSATAPMSSEVLKLCTMLTWLTDLAARRRSCEELKADSCMKHRMGRNPCQWTTSTSKCERSSVRCLASQERVAQRELVAAESSGHVEKPKSFEERLRFASARPVCFPPTPNATSVDCELRLPGSLSDGRFFTLLAPRHPGDSPLLVWKNGTHDGDVLARPLAAHYCAFDPRSASAILLPWHDRHTMTHNTAFFVAGTKVVALGGQHLMSKPHSKVRQRGVLHVEWESSTFSARWPRQEHSTARFVFNGSHPGCVERLSASPLPGVCSFDGRLSVASLNGIYHLYARQNPTARCAAGSTHPAGGPRLLTAYPTAFLHSARFYTVPTWVALVAGATATCSTLSPPTSSPGRRSNLCASLALVPPRGMRVQARSIPSVRRDAMREPP